MDKVIIMSVVMVLVAFTAFAIGVETNSNMLYNKCVERIDGRKCQWIK